LLNISQPYKKTVLMYKSKSLWLIPSFKKYRRSISSCRKDLAFIFFRNFKSVIRLWGNAIWKTVNQARKLLNANVFQNPRYSVKHGKRVKLMKIYF
jgi:hypothetical protein